MNDRHDSLVALCLFALLFSLYLLTFSGVYHSSDEMSMLAATDSLARRGQWDIELLRWMGEQQGSFGPDGYLYSRKGIGTTLAALPHYFLAVQSSSVGNVQTAMLTNGVVTALTGVLVYLFLRRLRYGAGVSLGTALAYGLGTMAWPYARYLFSESLAALGLMLSAYFLVRFRDQGDRLSVVLAGAGLGIALLSRLNNAMVAPFLGLLLLVYLHQAHGRNLRKWAGPIVLFGLPVLAALVVIGWYNWLRFGSPLTTGYLPEERFGTPFFEGLYGLLLSPGKGLLWYSPVLFAALVAWLAFFRRHRAEALLIAAIVLSNMVFYAPWYLWWAGHAWGPRFLVTILPFATLPLAEALKAARDRRWIAGMLAVLALVSIAVQLLGVAVDFNLYLEEIHAELGLYHPATLFDPDYSPLLRQITYLRLESLDLAWARGGSIEWLALLLGVFAVAVSGIALAVAVTGRPVRKRPSRWVGVGLPVLLAVVTVGLLLLYAPGGDVARAAEALAAMEQPGEVAALTGPVHTEAFQDAYDGHLWVWGVPSKDQVETDQDEGQGAVGGTWAIGRGDPDPAAARFQVGAIRLELFPLSGQPFDAARLPTQPLERELNLGGTVDLIAADLGETKVRPGETLPLALYWRAIAPMDRSYTVFVQAVDDEGTKAGQVDRLPCNGDCPTVTWRPGDLVGERYDLAVRGDAPPGQYWLIVGMYDLETGENLTAYDSQGNAAGTYLEFGAIQVSP